MIHPTNHNDDPYLDEIELEHAEAFVDIWLECASLVDLPSEGLADIANENVHQIHHAQLWVLTQAPGNDAAAHLANTLGQHEEVFSSFFLHPLERIRFLKASARLLTTEVERIRHLLQVVSLYCSIGDNFASYGNLIGWQRTHGGFCGGIDGQDVPRSSSDAYNSATVLLKDLHGFLSEGLDPDLRVDVLRITGLVLSRTGELKLAAIALEGLLKHCPNATADIKTQVMVDLASINGQMRNYSRAVELLEMVVPQSAENNNTSRLLGMAYAHVGRFKEAIDLLEHVVMTSDELEVAEPLHALAQANALKSDFDTAIHYSNQAVACFASHQNWQRGAQELSNLGAYYFRAGDLVASVYALTVGITVAYCINNKGGNVNNIRWHAGLLLKLHQAATEFMVSSSAEGEDRALRGQLLRETHNNMSRLIGSNEVLKSNSVTQTEFKEEGDALVRSAKLQGEKGQYAAASASCSEAAALFMVGQQWSDAFDAFRVGGCYALQAGILSDTIYYFVQAIVLGVCIAPECQLPEHIEIMELVVRNLDEAATVNAVTWPGSYDPFEGGSIALWQLLVQKGDHKSPYDGLIGNEKAASGVLLSGEELLVLKVLGSNPEFDGRLLQNARGVCLMRMAYPDQALNLFAELVMEDGPLSFATNFATALLMNQRVEECANVLADLKTLAHNSDIYTNIEKAVQEWDRSTTPSKLPFPVGEIILDICDSDPEC